MKRIILSLCFFTSLCNIAEAQSTNQFVTYNTANTSVFATNNFKAIALGKSGHIWAGTQYGGLYKYNPNLMIWEKSPDLTTVFINDIKTDKNGGIWIGQSGTAGTVGGGGNIAGGINYYPSEFFSVMNFYSITPGGGLSSRNVRSLWIDTSRNIGASNPRVWAAQGTFITSNNTSTGGIGLGLNPSADYFSKIKNGLQQGGTPSCLAVGGNQQEVWVMAQANNGKSQILRYNSGNINGIFLGAYDNTNVSVLSSGFRASAIYFDVDNRQWIGQQSGGLIVKSGAEWINLNFPSVVPPGTTINNNAITGDPDGNIYIGTTNGLVVYRGGAIDSASSYELLTTNDGLPSNNITGIAADTANSRILLTTDAGVCFWKMNNKIKVKLAWDYSFPPINANPRGVAADGVSRLYLKIRRGNDTLPKIKEVKVTVKDFDSYRSTLRGRVKKATELDKYSKEASTSTDIEASRTDSTSEGDFQFWYTSPEDFCTDSTGSFSRLDERKDTLKIKVTYENLKEDSVEYYMKVVRPPLLLVHGLASGPSTWDSLYQDGQYLFVQSPAFRYKRALTMNGRGAFMENSQRLLNGDLNAGADRLNSLQGNIEEMRKLGFASNQVDYLCHSMGGLMIRGTIGWYPDKFFADGNYTYNNYGKGFVHKLIFVNTPHNSSPIADAVHEFIPQLPSWLNYIITYGYKKDPTRQQPFDFIIPSDTTSSTYKFKESDAVRDLQITDSWGGVNMPATNHIKNHLIIGDVDMTTTTLDSLAQANKGFVELSNLLVQVARDKYKDQRDSLTFLFDDNYSPRQRMVLWWNLYSGKKGFPGFMADGDLIVPLASETARQPETSPNITKFLNSPGSAYDASHVTILGRRDVGKRIFNLLNSPVNNNPLFGDDVPANYDAEPQQRKAGFRQAEANDVVVTTQYDTGKIVITTPSRTGVAAYADSLINVKFKIKDTTALAYIEIHFQNKDSFRLNKSSSQEIKLKTDGVYTGNQTLWAVAVYDKDNAVEYHIDTLSLSVANLAAPQGFRIQEELVEVTDKIKYTPSYEVLYNGNWSKLLNSDTLVKITFNPSGIVGFDSSTYSFKALQEGFAQAYFSYQGFRDTLSFNSVMQASVRDITFRGKVFLQGAYNSASRNMNTVLNSSGILQSQAAAQPYQQKSFSYFGTEKVSAGFFAANPDIVDWVLVELRDSSLPTAVVASRAAFVKQDGTLVDTSNTQITFKNAPAGSYYVVIKHRNHLPVRSSSPINFSSGAGSYDFTTSLSSAFAGSVSNAPMATLAPGVYGMWGGNINNDNQVKMTGFSADTNDYLKLLNVLGNSINTLSNVYSNQDINMDGKVNMTGISAETNDYLKLLNMLGSSINQISQPAF